MKNSQKPQVLKGHDFSRAQVADKPAALKGHVFRRAAKTHKKNAALAAEGRISILVGLCQQSGARL